MKGRGGVLGPDFSRDRASHARRSRRRFGIRTRRPPRGYQAITLVTRDGQRVRGARKSEDALSIQIMDTNEQLRGFLKSSLREVISDPASLMPRVRAGSS